VEVPRAVNEGVPIVLAKPDSAAAKAYRSLADEFLRREGQVSGQPEAGGQEQRESAQGVRGLAGSLGSHDSNGKPQDEALDAPRKRLRLSSRRR
jgi:MinD-like ATPase involved in chromosome partitioning or flagellar assembly